MQTVTVRGVWLPGRLAQVAVWERDPRHRGGELYLTSGQVAAVYLTPGVNAALARGSLELVEELADGNPPPLTVEESQVAQAEPATKAEDTKVAKVADTKVTKAGDTKMAKVADAKAAKSR